MFPREKQHRQTAGWNDDLGSVIDERQDFAAELLLDLRVDFLVLKSLHIGGHLRVDCPHTYRASAQAEANDLITMPRDEYGINGHHAERAAQRTRIEHRRLAETDHRDFDRCPAFDQSGLLEVADDKSIIALLFGRNRIADYLRRGAELGQWIEITVGRRNAVNLEAHMGIGIAFQILFEARNIRVLLGGIYKTLIPNPRRAESHSRLHGRQLLRAHGDSPRDCVLNANACGYAITRITLHTLAEVEIVRRFSFIPVHYLNGGPLLPTPSAHLTGAPSR